MRLIITKRDITKNKPHGEGKFCKLGKVCALSIVGLCDMLNCEDFEAKEVKRDLYSIKNKDAKT